jgi:hypothetical protein
MKKGRAGRQGWMHSVVASALLVCCAYTQAAGATKSAANKPRVIHSEPFASFELIDARLTQISKVLPRLSADIPKARKSHAQATPVNSAMVQDVEELRSSVSSIQSTTRKLQAHYGERRQKYGVLIFSQLARKSDNMQNGLSPISKAKSHESVQSALSGFSKAMLPFVLQFQAVSGGYRALHCQPGTWSCCRPRKITIGRDERFSGCKWDCTKRRARCRAGCLGPRMPGTQ